MRTARTGSSVLFKDWNDGIYTIESRVAAAPFAELESDKTEQQQHRGLQKGLSASLLPTQPVAFFTNTS